MEHCLILVKLAYLKHYVVNILNTCTWAVAVKSLSLVVVEVACIYTTFAGTEFIFHLSVLMEQFMRKDTQSVAIPGTGHHYFLSSIKQHANKACWVMR